VKSLLPPFELVVKLYGSSQWPAKLEGSCSELTFALTFWKRSIGEV